MLDEFCLTPRSRRAQRSKWRDELRLVRFEDRRWASALRLHRALVSDSLISTFNSGQRDPLRSSPLPRAGHLRLRCSFQPFQSFRFNLAGFRCAPVCVKTDQSRVCHCEGVPAGGTTAAIQLRFRMDYFRRRQGFGGQVVAAPLAMTTRSLASAFHTVSPAPGYDVNLWSVPDSLISTLTQRSRSIPFQSPHFQIQP